MELKEQEKHKCQTEPLAVLTEIVSSLTRAVFIWVGGGQQ